MGWKIKYINLVCVCVCVIIIFILNDWEGVSFSTRHYIKLFDFPITPNVALHSRLVANGETWEFFILHSIKIG
jgi:hypothetical protein